MTQGFWLYFPVALMMMFGYVLKLTNYLSKETPKYLLEYVLGVALPIVIFHGISQVNPEDFFSEHKFVLAHTILVLIFQLGSLLLYRLSGLGVNEANSLSSSVFFPNIPFFALPFLLAMPNAYQYVHLLALGFLVSLFLFVAITIRIYIFSRDLKYHFALHHVIHEVFHIPLVITASIGFVIAVMHIELSPFVNAQIDKFHSVVSSTALIALGMGVRLESIFKCDIQMWSAVVGKSILMPLAACVLASILQLDAAPRLVLVAMAACPTASIASLVGQRFSKIAPRLDDIMFASTVVSLFLYGYWIQLAISGQRLFGAI